MRRLAVLWILSLWCTSSWGADPKIPFVKYKLANGLTVLLSEDHRLPLVSVNLWYRASPANEPPKRSGFAHLFEHMMFEGSKHVGDNQHIKLLEQNGVTLYNATTDFDRTNYFETLPSNRLELALWLESDRMGFLAEGLTQARLDNQREVVRNERRQSIENTPYAASEEALVQALFPAGHPYHGYVIGSHEDIDAATLSDVADFHRRFYTPANAVLAIAGAFQSTRARSLIAKYFAPLPGGKKISSSSSVSVPVVAARRITHDEPVALPRVWFGWVTPPIFRPADADLVLAAMVLGEGRSSRLYKHLVHEKQLASDVRCAQQSLLLGSFFECYATALPGKTIDALEAALQAELAELRTQPISTAELERARNVAFADKVRRLEQLGGMGGKSDVLQYYEHYRGDPGYLGQDLARYRAVTPATILAAAKEHLTDAHRITLITNARKTAMGEQP